MLKITLAIAQQRVVYNTVWVYLSLRAFLLNKSNLYYYLQWSCFVVPGYIGYPGINPVNFIELLRIVWNEICQSQFSPLPFPCLPARLASQVSNSSSKAGKYELVTGFFLKLATYLLLTRST